MLRWRRSHWIGLLVGAGVGALAAGLSRAFGYALALEDGLIWGAAVGTIVMSLPDFAQSGAILTRRENRTVNAIVGLFGSLAFLLIFVALALLVLKLVS
jgi:hypothetical protein